MENRHRERRGKGSVRERHAGTVCVVVYISMCQCEGMPREKGKKERKKERMR